MKMVIPYANIEVEVEDKSADLFKAAGFIPAQQPKKSREQKKTSKTEKTTE